MARRQPTQEQRDKAAAKREAFRELVKTISEMDADARAALIDRCGAIVTADGAALSHFNTCLIISQSPKASIVGGFRQWLKHGRCVRKGQTGLNLWVPIANRGDAPETDPRNPEPESTDRASRQRFIMGTVFDISQTETLEQPAAEEPETLSPESLTREQWQEA